MKHTVATKFLAFFLAACALSAALICGGYALLLDQYGLYDSTPEEKMEQWYWAVGEPVAWRAAAKRTSQILGGCSDGLSEQLYGFLPNLNKEYYYVTIQQDGVVIPLEGEPIQGGYTFEYAVKPRYAQMVRFYPYNPNPTTDPTTDEDVDTPPDTQPEEPEKEPDYDERVDILEDGQQLIYEVKYLTDSPTYTVSVTMAPEALQETFHANMIAIFPYRNTVIWGMVLSLVVVAAAVVGLICAAGRSRDGSICPGGLNRLPLDLYVAGAGSLSYLFGHQMWLIYVGNNTLNFLQASLLVMLGILIGLLIVAVIFALAAQIKAGNGYWWKHSVLGHIAKGCGILLKKMPIIGQWLLIIGLLLIAALVSFLLSVANNWHWVWLTAFVISALGSLAVLGYGGWSFATIVTGARRMAGGELDYKIPTNQLRGSFRDCAQQLNALSETTIQAVQSQVRSERMKTELITNVSHDIKTPLTSIVNFVDLLSRPHTQEADKQYLEVLSRQSNQLKKLIEDLIELSKASSGNLQAHIVELDLTEAVNQALGEFGDKLEKAKLTPVFNRPEERPLVAADGRMTWRVLSNLLSNAVKYATPGTRVYVELDRVEDQVQLSIKNVSKEELRLSADELLERFVRGDASRNREGSGLGLNIAKSLMEVQHGSLRLTLDGDLFKVTLTFPTTTPPMENI
ncbi:MAG: HAMP domain-containing histidine kinase [Ruminococcaceae bacterium]|nr:HAMP domain-containing histidine kinase [Oscillospiraceae bacterium]